MSWTIHAFVPLCFLGGLDIERIPNFLSIILYSERRLTPQSTDYAKIMQIFTTLFYNPPSSVIIIDLETSQIITETCLKSKSKMQNLPLLLEPVDEEKKMKENSNDLNNNLLNFKEKREELEVDITSLGKKIERKTNKNKPARESIVEYIKKE